MSGHSKWHRIRHKKAIADAKRGQQFTKLSSDIKQAAVQGGIYPDKNPALRDAIQRAKDANMPQVNIDRILERASAKTDKTITYEGFGPGGISLLIVAATDNNNRTVSELRTLLKNNGGNLGQTGSVMWKFQKSEDGQSYEASYTQPLGEKEHEQAAKLLAEIDNHPDVVSVFTDIEKTQ